MTQETAANKIPPYRPNRMVWSLRTLLLWVLIAAGLVVIIKNHFRRHQLAIELNSLEQLADELLVSTPNQVAVRRRDFSKQNEITWQLFLPKGYVYKLNLATSNPRDDFEIAELRPETKCELPPGLRDIQFSLSVANDELTIRVSNGSIPLLESQKSFDWAVGGGRDDIFVSEKSISIPPDQPVILLSRHYDGLGIRNNVKNGIWLWIQATPN